MRIDSRVMATLGGSITTWGEGHHSLCHHHFYPQYVVIMCGRVDKLKRASKIPRAECHNIACQSGGPKQHRR